MATRSSAKLLHSKSYAETRKHAETSLRLRRTKKISGGGINILYFTVQRLYSFWALIWSSEKWHQCRVTISLPKVTASLRFEETRVGGGRRTQVKARGGDRWARRKSDTTCIFLPAQQFSCWFLLLSHVLQCVGGDWVSWPWDGESTTSTGTEHLHWPFRKVMSKHNAYYSCDILYKYCNTGHVQCHHVCSL